MVTKGALRGQKSSLHSSSEGGRDGATWEDKFVREDVVTASPYSDRASKTRINGPMW